MVLVFVKAGCLAFFLSSIYFFSSPWLLCFFDVVFLRVALGERRGRAGKVLFSSALTVHLSHSLSVIRFCLSLLFIVFWICCFGLLVL